MIQILELIKLLGLGIASAILFITITMAEISQTKDFIKAVEEVRQEYPEESIERKLPASFIATIAATETGNFQFEGAPTAKKANNFFGIHATGNQNYIETSGGAKLRSFDDSKGSIRAFMSLIANDERYKDAINAIDKGPQEMFKGMSVYAENYGLQDESDQQIILKMKLPKKLQKDILSKPIKISKAKTQTDRLFA